MYVCSASIQRLSFSHKPLQILNSKEISGQSGFYKEVVKEILH